MRTDVTSIADATKQERRTDRRIPCRTKLLLEHARTGRTLPGQGINISNGGMKIRILDEHLDGLAAEEGLYLRIDPGEEVHSDTAGTLCLASMIVRLWPSDNNEGQTNIAVEFVPRLEPQTVASPSEGEIDAATTGKNIDGEPVL